MINSVIRENLYNRIYQKEAMIMAIDHIEATFSNGFKEIVIIVIDAINTLKSRVLGTLIKYNLENKKFVFL